MTFCMTFVPSLLVLQEVFFLHQKRMLALPQHDFLPAQLCAPDSECHMRKSLISSRFLSGYYIQCRPSLQSTGACAQEHAAVRAALAEALRDRQLLEADLRRSSADHGRRNSKALKANLALEGHLKCELLVRIFFLSQPNRSDWAKSCTRYLQGPLPEIASRSDGPRLPIERGFCGRLRADCCI